MLAVSNVDTRVHKHIDVELDMQVSIVYINIYSYYGSNGAIVQCEYATCEG